MKKNIWEGTFDMVKDRIPMKEGTQFTMGGISLRIDDREDQVSKGSSCLVYHGQIVSENGIVPKRVIIKEFYPDFKQNEDFQIVREEDSGCLFVSENTKESTQYKLAWEQYMKGLERQKELAFSGAMEVAVKPIAIGRHGDSHYIVSDAHLGADLKQAEPMTLKEKLSAAVSLTETMGILHEEGYVMLDFKPENFLWIRKPSLVILIDTDSLVSYKKPELSKTNRFYINSRYIAPQIRMLERYMEKGVSDKEFERLKKANLKPINDLYAIGSYLYHLFFHDYWQGGTLGESQKEDLMNTFIKEYTSCENQSMDKIEAAGRELIEVISKLLIEDLFDRMEQGFADAKELMEELSAIYFAYSSSKHISRNEIVHPDTVKLNNLLDWIKKENMADRAEFKDGKVLLNGQDVFSLEQVPFYKLNKTVQNLREQKESLSETLYELRRKNVENPRDDEVFHKLLTVSDELGKVREQLHELEKNMFDHYSKILQMDDDGQVMTARGNAARHLIEIGNYEEAVALLNEEEREKELNAAKNMAAQGLNRIKGYLHENKIKISLLNLQGLNQEQIEKLEACYKENSELAETYHIEYNCMYEYAAFLHSVHRFTDAMDLIVRLEKIYEIQTTVDAVDRMDFFLLKANIHTMFNQLTQSMECLEQAKDLCEETDDQENLFAVYNNLGNYYARMGLENLGAFYHRKGMETKKAEQGREYALSCGNLANCLLAMAKKTSKVYQQQLLLEECEKLYDQAIEIEEELNKEDRLKDLGRLSEVYYNMAYFYFETGRQDDAISLCKASLSISRQETMENPSKGWIAVVQRLKELAFYYDVKGEFANSKPLYEEAIQIMERLHVYEPKAYLEVMKHLYRNYAYFLHMTGKVKKSTIYLKKSNDIKGEGL